MADKEKEVKEKKEKDKKKKKANLNNFKSAYFSYYDDIKTNIKQDW